MKKQPMQPIVIINDIIRFKQNVIVRYQQVTKIECSLLNLLVIQ